MYRLLHFLYVALLTACAGSAATPSPPAASSAGPLDDAVATQRVHAFFDAVDRRDLDTVRRMTGDGFVLFEQGHAVGRKGFGASWAKANDSGMPPRTRTCTDEMLYRGATAIVYIGDCTEDQPAHEDRAAEEWQGWNTVVLVPEGGTWKIALWQWDPSGVEAARARWNEAYRRGTWFTKEPNKLLARSIEAIPPGTALVLAMGQGRNALHLAERGWQVTGVDISDEGIRQARAAARERALALDAVLADIDEFELGVERWNLVTMVYAGASEQWMERIAPSLKPGGLFVLEFFYKDPNDPDARFGVDPAVLERIFDGWDILVSEVVDDVADWGKREESLVRFVARKPGG